MGQIHVLQRRVEVAQQGLAMFEDEARGAGAKLTDAFGRIEDVLREKDFQLVRRELEVQRLSRENAQARMLLETLLETVEQRKPTSLREVIEEFERRLAACTALNGAAEPTSEGNAEAPAEEPASPARAAPAEAAPESEPAAGFTLAELMAAEPAEPAPPTPAPVPPPSPLAAFADPAGHATFTVAATPPEAPPAEAPAEAAEDVPEEPAAEILPPGAVVRAMPDFDANEELIADARAHLRSRKGGARLMEEEQRRYAYKIWLGPILLGAGTLGPLALVLASIAH